MSTFTVLNPATEEPVTTLTQASAEEADEAIARASAASAAWRAVTPGDRARLLRAFAAAVDAASEELAGLEVSGSGHPIGAARWEAGQVRDVLLYYSAAPERLSGKQIPVPGGLNVTFHEPVGVVGLIVPWNFPMPILSWGMAPALAAGCTVVAKPAEATPLTAMRIGELALEAGLPEGVFQVLPGKGSVVGQRLVDHPAVRKIVFTGSTEVGQRIMADCARQVKRLTLELGGKSANIVFADADLEKAAATAPYAVFDNAGQDCCARSRILVQRSVLRQVHGAVRTRGSRCGGRRSRLDGDRDGPADRGGAPGAGRLLRAIRALRCLPRPCAVRAGFWFPPTVLAPRAPGRPGVHRGDLRPGGDRDPVRRRGGRRAHRQRHARTACPDPSGPATSAARSGWPGRSRRATVSVNSHSSRALLDAVRRLQAVRPRPRTGPGRPVRVHRDQERLHFARE